MRRASAAFYFISHWFLTSCFSLRLDQNGTVQCEAISCPPPQCPAGTAPAYVKGACCKECQREWRSLNPVTLLHSDNHGPTCTQTDGRTTRSTSAAARFSARVPTLLREGMPDNRPGLCCVAKLPPHTPPETLPTFCIYMDQLIIQNSASRRRWPPDTQTSTSESVIVASDAADLFSLGGKVRKKEMLNT